MTPEHIWHSPCLRGHVVERNGLLWRYIDEDHVGTQLSLGKAKALVIAKLWDLEV